MINTGMTTATPTTTTTTKTTRAKRTARATPRAATTRARRTATRPILLTNALNKTKKLTEFNKLYGIPNTLVASKVVASYLDRAKNAKGYKGYNEAMMKAIVKRAAAQIHRAMKTSMRLKQATDKKIQAEWLKLVTDKSMVKQLRTLPNEAWFTEFTDLEKALKETFKTR